MVNIRCNLTAASAVLLAGFVLMGCAALPAAAPAAPASNTPLAAPHQLTPEATMPPPIKPSSPLSTPRATLGRPDSSLITNTARRDLAQRLNVAEDQIEVVSVERTEMPIGSLGCGETGGRQNQGLIIGDEIVLRAAGQEYTYRSGGGKPVLCSPITSSSGAPGGQQAPPAAAATPAAQPTVQDLAIADLARRLGITATAITVREVIEAEWSDASLGCPEPGMMYAQVITRGQQIVLETNGQTYEYHAARGYVILCQAQP